MRSNELTNLFVVLAVSFGAPLVHNLVRRTKVPQIIVEILLGLAIGPQALHWVKADSTVNVVAMLGLSLLLYLAGSEVDIRQLAGPLGKKAMTAFGASLVLAVGCGYGLSGLGVVPNPLLLAVILTATSLGIVVPVLRDSVGTQSSVGQFVLAGAAVGDAVAIILLSLLFSRDSSAPGPRLALVAGFVAIIGGVAWLGSRRSQSMAIARVLDKLQDTNAQIRVRGTMVIVIGFGVLADRFGLETILGSFIAGVMVSALDSEAEVSHPLLRVKLDAVAFGFLVPVFFVTSGIKFDIKSLISQPSNLAKVPIFLVALLIVRGLPALAYRSQFGWRGACAAGFFLATSLPFIVAAAAIGVSLGALTSAVAAALVGAGLLSAVIFPIVGASLVAYNPKVPAAHE